MSIPQANDYGRVEHGDRQAAPNGAAVGPRPGAASGATRAAPDWELVRKRNNIEKLKHEKAPLSIVDEIEVLAARDYLDVSEEDMVRFQWYGLYHDKPKTGYMMLRIKVPAGRLTAPQYRAIGELSQKFGRDYSELTTRQTVQIHWIRIADLPEVFATLSSVGLTSKGGCGDAVRNVTGCPVSGLDSSELFDCQPYLDELVEYFLSHDEYLDLPRKHKISMSTCAEQCNAPEINCINFVGARQVGADGTERLGFAVRVGGGLSSTPRISKHLGVFIAPDEAIPVARALLDVWRTDLKYRMSRAKARMKFLVDDYGVDLLREKVEENLGRKLDDLAELPVATGHTDHLGITPEKGAEMVSIGVPAYLGLVTGEQTVAIAELAATYGGEIRLTRQQNFILTGVPEARVDEVTARLAELKLPIDAGRLRGSSIACTGQPLCNFAVAGTKTKLGEIVERLEARFGTEADGLKLGVDGCPHSCAHHWVTDIGLQGTTGRGEAGQAKQEAYEIYLRGGLGADAAIGRPILRRVPAAEAPAYVERLVGGYLAERGADESFQAFAIRKSDEELIQLATGQPAVAATTGGA